jgi:hypothetical protein
MDRHRGFVRHRKGSIAANDSTLSSPSL